MLTRAEAEAVVMQAAGYQQHDQAGKAKLRAAAAAKHEREAEDFRTFAAVDQAARTSRIAQGVIRAAAGLEAAQAAEAEAEDKAAEALRAERAAEDRAREHAEHARRAHETWKRVQGRGTPPEQTEALKNTQAAAQVAQGEQAAAEGKTAARVLAGRELETARARVTEAEDTLRAVQDLAAHPGRALYSPQTCAENVPHLLRIWDQLQPLEQQFVRQAITALAMISGVYDQIKMKGAAEARAGAEPPRPQPASQPVALPGLPGMPGLPVAMPGVAGR